MNGGRATGWGRWPQQFITSNLYARVALAKAVDAAAYLAIHGNGASVNSIREPETWYCGKLGEGVTNEAFATGVHSCRIARQPGDEHTEGVKIVVLGSFNMDLVMRAERRPVDGETLQGEFAMYLGGKGFNQAIAARRLGAEVAVIGRVGDDEFGRQFIAALGREGIDARALRVDSAAGTGVASIVIEPDGANAILQAPRANRQLSASDIASAGEAFAGADVAMLQLETSMEAAQAFAMAAREHDATVLLNPAPASAVPAELLALTDVLVPNEIEAETLTGLRIETIDDAHAAAGALQAQGPRTVVITLGARGAVSAGDEAQTHQAGHAVDAVDTVGAGDAFCAALAVALAEGATLIDAVAFANAAGAAATMRHGAEPSMPTRREVAAVAAKGVRR